MKILNVFLVILGPDSIQRCHLTSIGIPIVEIRRSYDRLISTMGFPILVRLYLYIESGPRAQWLARSPDTSISNMLYVSCLKIPSNYCYTHQRRYNTTVPVSACNTTHTVGTFPREWYKTMVGRYLQKPPRWLMTSHVCFFIVVFSLLLLLLLYEWLPVQWIHLCGRFSAQMTSNAKLCCFLSCASEVKIVDHCDIKK